MTPALFLDRDGVINVDHGYVHRQADFEFLPGIFDLVRCARSLGMVTVVITNQAGIGRGLYTESDFAGLTAWMCEQFARQSAPIARVYFCPTHPSAGLDHYRVDSPMRKPNPGMVLAAKRDLALDLSGSVLLGDKPTDLQAGLAAGVALNLMLAPAAARPILPTGGEQVSSLSEAQSRLVAFRACQAAADACRSTSGGRAAGDRDAQGSEL